MSTAEIHIRSITPADTEACAHIIFNAFKGIADKHNFRPDFPSAEVVLGIASLFIGSPFIFGVVAECEGRIVGSNFLSEYDAIRGVGPITVDPAFQSAGVGRRLMQAVLERGKDAAGIRLLQDGFNTTSLSLYASLGFEVKEPVVIVEGEPAGTIPPGVEVRHLREGDMAACGELYKRIHGFERVNELRHTSIFAPFVALREGRVTAYASAHNFWAMNHAVAETEEDMHALLIGAVASSGLPASIIVPTRQAGLFRWCLGKKMRVIKPMTLMAMGQYQQPKGCYIPSVGY